MNEFDQVFQVCIEYFPSVCMLLKVNNLSINPQKQVLFRSKHACTHGQEVFIPQ